MDYNRKSPISKEIFDKVVQLKSTKFKTPEIDGIKIGSSYVEELVGVSDKGLLLLASKGIFVKDEFVCWGGVCYNPNICLGAKDSGEVIEAWGWFTKQLKVEKAKFEDYIEKTSLIDWIHFGTNPIYVPKIINLAVDLFRLTNLGVDVSKKIHEINRNIVGNFKKGRRSNKLGIELRYHKHIGHYLADLAAETKVAIVAKLLKYDVKLHMAHDVIIGGFNVQVKNIRRTNNPLTIYNAIESGFQHGAKIVVVSHLVPIDLELFVKTTNGRFWGEEMSLYEAIDTAVEIVSKGKIVVFFKGALEGYLARVVLL